MIKASDKYNIQDYKHAGRGGKYPWETMKVGESFPLEGKGSCLGYTSLANKRYAPKCFTMRTTEDGPRIFRVK